MMKSRRKSGVSIPSAPPSGCGSDATSWTSSSINTVSTGSAITIVHSNSADVAAECTIADPNGAENGAKSKGGICGGRWSTSTSVRCYCCVVILLIAICSVVETIFVLNRIFPEPDLVLHSKCKNPLRNWDGKVLDHLVWDTGFHKKRPNYFSVHRENEYIGNDSNQRVQWDSDDEAQAVRNRPVVIWGTHHKTGTFLAKKIFAKLCGMLKWCCLFHLTRDSIHAVMDGMRTELVDGFGHNQWIWPPQALNLGNYRFIHFYRHPFKKIVSGFRYHSDGTEEWTKKSLEFHRICSNPLVSRDERSVDQYVQQNGSISRHLTDIHFSRGIDEYSKAALLERNPRLIRLHRSRSTGRKGENYERVYSLISQNADSKLRDQRRINDLNPSVENKLHLDSFNQQELQQDEQVVSSDDVWDLCRSVHLCETCCRLEHEIPIGTIRGKEDSQRNTGYSVLYHRRPQFEYDFLCKYLGGGSDSRNIDVSRATNTSPPSLKQMLTTRTSEQPIEYGLLVEAALDYYENLRMAHIINETATDLNSLHIDLDELSNNFSKVIWRILDHLKGFIPTNRIRAVHKELLFYDLNNSPMYRWSMDNPIINHVTSTATKETASAKNLRINNIDQRPAAEKRLQSYPSSALVAMLEANEDVQRLYQPVFDSMSSVLRKE